MDELRVLIAYEDSHRSYGQTMASAIRRLRPAAEVSVVQVHELGSVVGGQAPHLVVCNRSNTVAPGSRAAWARLSNEPEEASEFCLDGQRREIKNPGFDELLAIIDETAELVRSGRELGGC
jgi:hypothetical protein